MHPLLLSLAATRTNLTSIPPITGNHPPHPTPKEGPPTHLLLLMVGCSGTLLQTSKMISIHETIDVSVTDQALWFRGWQTQSLQVRPAGYNPTVAPPHQDKGKDVESHSLENTVSWGTKNVQDNYLPHPQNLQSTMFVSVLTYKFGSHNFSKRNQYDILSTCLRYH